MQGKQCYNLLVQGGLGSKRVSEKVNFFQGGNARNIKKKLIIIVYMKKKLIFSHMSFKT